MAVDVPSVPRMPDAGSLAEAVAPRARDQELVMVLHPDVPLDDTRFELDNTGVTVRRNVLVREPHQVFIFDRDELLKAGMATVTDDGIEVTRLPGSGAPG